MGAELRVFINKIARTGQAVFVDDDVERVTMVQVKPRKSKPGGMKVDRMGQLEQGNILRPLTHRMLPTEGVSQGVLRPRKVIGERMPSKLNWAKVLMLVESDRRLRPFRQFLLSPDKVHDIVRMTNAGHIQQASDFVNQAEWLLQQIQQLDRGLDLTWDFEVIRDIRRSLELAEAQDNSEDCSSALP